MVITELDQVKDGVAADGYAYIANGVEGLVIVDISTPESYLVITSLLMPDDALAVETDGTYAYVASYAGMTIVDVTIKDSPSIVKTVDLDYANDLFLYGDYIFIEGSVTGDGYGIYVIDISSPGDADIIDGVSSSKFSSVQDLVVYEEYAYITCYDQGLRIIELY